MTDDGPTWQRFYGDVPRTIAYPDCGVYDVVRDTIRRLPDAVAYEFLGTTTTYAVLGRRVDRLALGLTRLGVSAGDRLMIALPTCPQAVQAYYAAGSLGAVPVMVHPLSTPEEIERYAIQSRSRHALGLDLGYHRFTAALEAGSLETLVVTSIGDALPSLKRLVYRLTKGRHAPRVPFGGPVHRWNDLLAVRGAPPPRPTIDTQALGTILFSGGTMGEPKAVMLSHRNLISEGMQLARWVSLREGDRVLAILPLFHGIGLSVLVNAPLMAGCRVILVPQFSVDAVARVIRRTRPNLMAGVPSMYAALLRSPIFRSTDLSCVRAAFSGGDALPKKTREEFDRLLAERGSHGRLLEAWGLTEAVAGVIAMPLHLEHEGSVGLPFPDTLAAIFDPGTDRELPAGAPGEICVSSPAVMLGYLDDPAATVAALRHHRDGRIWLHTGDIGHRDGDGFFYFEGRLKRLIKSSGFNVFPNQVERVLAAHPAVQETCVVGVPDESRGERVKAYVVVKPPAVGTPDLAAELIAHCRQHLIKWSCPREIEFRPALPKTRIGKVDHRALLRGTPESAEATA